MRSEHMDKCDNPALTVSTYGNDEAEEIDEEEAFEIGRDNEPDVNIVFGRQVSNKRNEENKENEEDEENEEDMKNEEDKENETDEEDETDKKDENNRREGGGGAEDGCQGIATVLHLLITLAS